eukprot:2781003-Pyramimonas_sp.AAC.1
MERHGRGGGGGGEQEEHVSSTMGPRPRKAIYESYDWLQSIGSTMFLRNLGPRSGSSSHSIPTLF